MIRIIKAVAVLRRHTRRLPAGRAASVAACGLLTLLLLPGCGEGLPETVPVSGRVTFQGQPLDSGQVVFHPQSIPEGLPRRPATGVLDREGRFQLTTFRTGDGAVPGTYQVAIFSYLSDQTSAEDDVAIPETVWRIPERYGNPQQSGLTANVTPESDEPLSFEFKLTVTNPNP